jgi:hypothetical protein
MHPPPRRRLLLATFVSGVLMNALDALVNGVFFLQEFRDNAARLGLDPAAAQAPLAVVLWIAEDFVFGFVLASVYGAFRQRDDAGLVTALKAAAVLYVPTTSVIVGFGVLGMLTPTLLAKMALSGLAIVALGAVVAGKLYE